MREYSTEAEALFGRLAERHSLHFEVDHSAPVEVLWRFPEQDRLFFPLILGLQNNDELNFGVAKFWSYFWPFPEKAAEFEHIVDAWVIGKARIVSRVFSEDLQLWGGTQWRKVYSAGRIWPEFGVGRIVQNRSG